VSIFRRHYIDGASVSTCGNGSAPDGQIRTGDKRRCCVCTGAPYLIAGNCESEDFTRTTVPGVSEARPAEVHLTVVVHTDVKPLHFRKVEGLNQNRLTLACALFEDTERYITGTKQLLSMKLRDETLAATLESGVTTRAEFDAKPGRYVVRVVVLDDEGHLSASDSIVDTR
jgi:hypothetical protein